MRVEAKVGLFVFLGLLSLFVLSMQVNSFSNFGKKGYKIYAYINDATGLRKNAKIKLRGVDVGYVLNKTLQHNKVKLTFFIKEGIKIPIGSTIMLSQDGMLSEKYIKIIPSNNAEFIAQGGVISNYKKYATFDETVDSINAAANEFRAFMNKLNTAVDKEAIANFKTTLANLKSSTQYLKTILKENRGNLHDTIAGAKQMVDTINARLPKIMAQIDDLTAEFKHTGKDINKKLPTLLKKFENIEDNLNEILVQNKKPLNKAIKSADTFFSAGGSTFKKLDNYFTSLTQSELDVDLATYYMTKDGYNQVRAELAYRPKLDKYYILGATSTNDYTDPQKFDAKHQETKTYITAELGKRYDNILFRGGLIESTGGIGVDYFMNNDKIKLKAEIFDFNAVNDIRGNNAHARIEARYQTLKHLNFYLGYDNFLNKSAANVYMGIGVGFSDDDLKKLLGSTSGSLLK
ncbi:MAG: MCE family protein [Epsilonproteobacteria bacterium]|nr:MCE family protein [Campylobacterota bacterium]